MAVDESGLLCALVLTPSTYSRNRHYELYQDRKMRRVFSRARLVRSLVRECVRLSEGTLSIEEHEQGGVRRVSFEVPSLNYKRNATLLPIEVDILQYLLGRKSGVVNAEVKARIEAALSRLYTD